MPHAPAASSALLAALLAASACTLDSEVARIERPVDAGAGMDANDGTDAESDAAHDVVAVIEDAPPGDGGAPRWTVTRLSSGRNLRAVWGTSARDVWAVGEGGTIAHWDGVRWSSPQNLFGNMFFRGVWASAPNDAWIVGWERFDVAVVLHWNGAFWSRDARVRASFPLRRVWGSSSTDVWAVGGSIESASNVAFRFNGAGWAPVSTGRYSQLFGLSGSARDDVWAVAGEQLLFRWNGAGWSVVPDRPPTFVSGGTWVPTRGEVWATAGNGDVLRYGPRGWSSDVAIRGEVLHGIWGASTSDAWVVGSRGAIARWNGAAWSPVTPRPASASLWDVWGAATGELWAVGDDGTIVRYGR